MSGSEAVALISSAVDPSLTRWADIGAGSGTFTLALQSLMDQGRIYAMDKSPHMLWRLEDTDSVKIQVVEGDFTRPFEMPMVEGMIMANALHYARDHHAALQHCLKHLENDGTWICIEYNRAKPSPPYVPYPIPEHRLISLCETVGLREVAVIAHKPSIYQGEMYVLMAKK